MSTYPPKTSDFCLTGDRADDGQEQGASKKVSSQREHTPRNPHSDTRVRKFEPLRAPVDLHSAVPVSQMLVDQIQGHRDTLRRCLQGEDRRLVVIVGPCSIHDEEAAYEYARRLKAISDQVFEKIFVVMRVYFEKPRTTVGWKGLINDPDLNGSYDVEKGLEKARRVLRTISEIGLPCATEFLDPIVPQYVADLVSWAAIGARTTESQTHREMVSGLSMPVGFKNGTDGAVDTAINAMLSARNPHAFLGIDENGRTAVVRTSGNPDVHIVLRGGKQGPNFDPTSVDAIAQNLAPHAAKGNRLILIDCSHGNSEKDYRRQGSVFRHIVEQWKEHGSSVLGAMIESHLVAGQQSLSANLTYGQSITDACIGIEETSELLLWAAGKASPSRPPA